MNEVATLIKQHVADILEVPLSDVDEYANFLTLGVSSIKILKIINRISRQLDMDINPVAMFEYQTITDFAAYLNQCLRDKELAS